MFSKAFKTSLLSKKTYKKSQDFITFYKANEKFGCFGNMAGGFAINIDNKLKINYGEQFYQAMKFTNHPEIQEKILLEKNPFFSKAIARKYNHLIRKDWHNISFEIMFLTIALKFQQHHSRILGLLYEIKGKPVIEVSKKDDFWGAIEGDQSYIGNNILGELILYYSKHIDNIEKIIESILDGVENLKILDINLSKIDPSSMKNNEYKIIGNNYKNIQQLSLF